MEHYIQAAIADALGSISHVANPIFGSDFLSKTFRSALLIDKFELLRHLAVLEGKVRSISDLPLEDEQVLVLMRSQTPTGSRVAFAGISQVDLVTSLELLHSRSHVDGSF